MSFFFITKSLPRASLMGFGGGAAFAPPPHLCHRPPPQRNAAAVPVFGCNKIKTERRLQENAAACFL